MALSLGVKVGSRIMVDEHLLEVVSIVQPNLIVISVDEGENVVVSDQARKKILPEVFVFSGVGSTGSGNRLAFEAPRSVKILRIPEG